MATNSRKPLSLLIPPKHSRHVRYIISSVHFYTRCPATPPSVYTCDKKTIVAWALYSCGPCSCCYPIDVHRTAEDIICGSLVGVTLSFFLLFLQFLATELTERERKREFMHWLCTLLLVESVCKMVVCLLCMLVFRKRIFLEVDWPFVMAAVLRPSLSSDKDSSEYESKRV